MAQLSEPGSNGPAAGLPPPPFISLSDIIKYNIALESPERIARSVPRRLQNGTHVNGGYSVPMPSLITLSDPPMWHQIAPQR